MGAAKKAIPVFMYTQKWFMDYLLEVLLASSAKSEWKDIRQRIANIDFVVFVDIKEKSAIMERMRKNRWDH